jgi:hypothetical protein
MERQFSTSVETSSRYAVLAANVSKVISTSSGRELNPSEKKLMEHATELLEKILQGSKFVERSEVHALSDPRESFFTFDHALSALNDTDLNFEFASEDLGEFTNIFIQLKQDLHQIAETNQLEERRRSRIRLFFEALRDLFYRDIADSSVAVQESELETVSL